MPGKPKKLSINQLIGLLINLKFRVNWQGSERKILNCILGFKFFLFCFKTITYFFGAMLYLRVLISNFIVSPRENIDWSLVILNVSQWPGTSWPNI